MDIRAFYSRIDDLGMLLRVQGMAHGVDVWLSVARLLDRLEQQGKLPDNASDLAPLLGPLFCRNPEDQARFPVLFKQWLKGENQYSLTTENRISSPGRSAFVAAQAVAGKTQKIWIVGGIGLIVCLIAVLLIKIPDWFQSKSVLPPVTKPVEETDKPAQPFPRRKPQPTTASAAIVDHVAPRPQPEPDYVQLAWENFVRNTGWALFALPWLPVLGFLAWRYQRNAVLRKQQKAVDDLLHHFHFDQPLQPFFGGAKVEQTLRELRAAQLVPTNRLHIAATIEATARNGGYFQPVYRNHRVAPEHVLLVRSQHRNDQQAALAEELEKRFKTLGLQVNTYRFRDDPRWLVRWHDDDSKVSYYQLHQLVARHEAARLLIISETAILFHPYSGEIRTWLDDFNPWQDKVWLHPRDAGATHATLLTRHRFLMLPLAQDNLPQLVEHLTKPQPHKLLPRQPHTLKLPEMIETEPDAWLGERPSYGTDLRLLMQQLEQFLHSDGMRLLRAVVVFPKPHWALTRALDYLLFGSLSTADSLQRREQRLALLSRLPWLMHAHLPDWLRENLLLGMSRNERQEIATVWQHLFNRLTDKESANSLNLEIRTPPKLQLKLKLDDLRAISNDDAINDPIFANILLGGKLGLLDFRIPQALIKLLPQTQLAVILRPAIVMLFWTLLGSGTLWSVWHYFGQHALIDYQRTQIAQHNSQWPVIISYHNDTEVLMTALQKNLESVQFEVTSQPDRDESKTADYNIIRYTDDSQIAAERIARSLMWLTYNTYVELVKKSDFTDKTIQVELKVLSNNSILNYSNISEKQKDHQELVIRSFHVAHIDVKQMVAMVKDIVKSKDIYVNEQLNLFIVRDTLETIRLIERLVSLNDHAELEVMLDEQESRLPFEPEMVRILPGKFTMPTFFDFQEVTIAHAFEIGKYEITFSEYETFAKATNRKLPDDLGWGRDKQPIINVSFDDAQAYVQWLSQQTGKKYRLPTEAEWEYAARAGTQTRYWWGDEIGRNNAVCRDCGSRWDGVKTAPVGSFEPNAFGLHDTAGNVWEWTQDCWDDSYQGVPNDGSARMEKDGEECFSRVIRGGGLLDYRSNLARNVRSWFFIHSNMKTLGFRIARDF